MAIYHFSAKPISRAQGRSATGAAAYRAGVEITDERTGLVHDYTRKGGVMHSELILPGGGAADRAEFWNGIEAHHKRGDAVLVREVEISLPTELTPEQRQALAVGYARELADRYGVAADVALHAPRTVTDRELEKNPDQHHETDPETGRRHNGNWHAHIMLSACHVQPDGTLGKKAVELDPIHCQRAKIENMADRERARWGELANAALERHGHETRIDHRSHAERGIEAEPSQHLGPQVHGYERRTGQPSAKRIQQEQDAAERLARAKALGELERQGKALDRGIIDLSGDLEAAKRERTALQRDQEQGQQAEHRRIERMTITELSHEIGRVRPPKALDLVERDRSVMQAEQERQTLEKRHAEAGSALARARGQAQAWREAHGIRAALHDKGLMQSSTLAELEQQGEAARIELLKLAPRIEDAALKVRSAREAAHLRINAEQAPALAKVDELERLRREKVRQEFEQQKRQQAEKKAEREREAVPKDFKLMAQKREMKASGWGDRGDQWQAAPDGLKKLIEGYNAAPKEARPAILDRILSDSSRREQVHGLIAEQRAQHRENDRGLSR